MASDEGTRVPGGGGMGGEAASTELGLEKLAALITARYPRAAITHEWLTIPGGSEQVVIAILELLPRAELFTSVYDPAPWPAAITSKRIHTSLLNRLPGAARHYPKLLPLMDMAFRSFDLSAFDLVVSSNHACAKNVRVPAGARHVCYCHTPMRYIWDPGFLAGERIGPVQRAAFATVLPGLRRADIRGARGVDQFVANSSVVADRIRAAYGRESRVIAPPVRIDRFLAQPRAAAPGAPYLAFGRLVPYKRVDLAIRACERLGRPLVVAGSGRDMKRLRSLARGNTRFIGQVPDEAVPNLLASSRALLFPGEEDFGIVPVEAQAAGLPVVGNGRGGVRDSVIDEETGVLYEEDTVEGLCEAIEHFESLRFDEERLRENARRFAPGHFFRQFAEMLLA